MPDFTPEQLQTYWNMAVDLTLTYVPRLLLALAVLLIGLWLIGRILKVMDKALDSAGMDTSLASFLHSLAGICLLYTSPSPRDRQKSRMPSSA